MLVRPSVGVFHEPTDEKYIGEAGKPSALKDARSVWGGGKAERPYLSLLLVVARSNAIHFGIIHKPWWK